MSDNNDGKGFLKSINFKQFMDTADELHAFIIGWGETVCFWLAWLWRGLITEDLKKMLAKERHYYIFGCVAGIATLYGMAELIHWRFF